MSPSRSTARLRLERGRHEGGAQIVAAALAITLPVKAVDILASVSQIEVTVSIYIRGSRDGITVVDIIVGDKQGAVATRGAHHPVVGLGSVGKVPAIGAVALKGAEIGHRGRNAVEGREGEAHVGAGVAATVGTEVEIIGTTSVEIINNVGGVVDRFVEGSCISARGEVDGVVLQHPGRSRAHLGPADGSPVNIDAVESQILDVGALRHLAYGDVVEIDIIVVGAASFNHKCNIA